MRLGTLKNKGRYVRQVDLTDPNLKVVDNFLGGVS